MFRGRGKDAGRWVTQELTKDELNQLLVETKEFNKVAFELSVQAANELCDEGLISESGKDNATKLFFDKLGMQSFSVINNRIQNLVE